VVKEIRMRAMVAFAWIAAIFAITLFPDVVAAALNNP
jgi:hypothetical protein